MRKDQFNHDMYNVIVNDISRYRDWPIRILTFTSALHYALIAALTLKELTLEVTAASIITIFLGVVLASTLYHFAHCHKEYLNLRNVQVKLNRRLLEQDGIYPEKWFTPRPVTLQEGIWGWGFYAIYAMVMFSLAVIVIWKYGFEW